MSMLSGLFRVHNCSCLSHSEPYTRKVNFTVCKFFLSKSDFSDLKGFFSFKDITDLFAHRHTYMCVHTNPHRRGEKGREG